MKNTACRLKDGTSFPTYLINDMHVHLRQDTTPDGGRPYTHLIIVQELAPYCGYTIGMGNTRPPILTGEQALEDATRTQQYASLVGGSQLRRIPSIKINRDTTPEIIFAAYDLGIRHGKVYPGDPHRTLTTHSDDGVIDYQSMDPVWEALNECSRGKERRDRWKLSQHGEAPGTYIMVSEGRFIPIMEYLMSKMPEVLHIFEHLTSADAIRFVMEGPWNLAGTLTSHHMRLTHDDVLRPLNPHHHCMPTAKGPEDRQMIRQGAVGGCERLFFGSDTAFWSKDDKVLCGCAGVLNVCVNPAVLAEVFEEEGGGISAEVIEAYGCFTHLNACRFYGLDPLPQKRLHLIKKPMKVPTKLADGIPWLAGQELPWSWEVLPLQ